MTLEKAVVHETHEKHEQIQITARNNLQPYGWVNAPIRAIVFFVLFVSFVDQKPFLG